MAGFNRRLAPRGVSGLGATAAIASLAVALFGGSAPAATRTWDGEGGNPGWGTGNNWDNNQVPASTDDVVFGTAFTSGTIITLDGNRTANSLTINGPDTIVISGSTLTLSSGSLSVNSTPDQFIASGVSIRANANWNIQGPGSLAVSGVVNDGGSALNLAKNGNGTLILSRVNSYTGGTTLNAGRLRVGIDNALPNSGTFIFAGGNLDAFNRSDTIGPVSLTANSTLTFGSELVRQDITFSSALPYGGGTLTITGWDGPTGNTYDRLIITSDPTGSGLLDHIQFSGYPLGAAWIRGSGEIVPRQPAIILTNAAKLPNGAFQFVFTNTAGATFTALATTNLSSPINWTVLGPVPEISPGQFQFVDVRATNGGRQFYRVRSP